MFGFSRWQPNPPASTPDPRMAAGSERRRWGADRPSPRWQSGSDLAACGDLRSLLPFLAWAVALGPSGD
ncbi:hypothetical protein ACP70R_000225 [Stipagrostis hirtigluma subsp. patula]